MKTQKQNNILKKYPFACKTVVVAILAITLFSPIANFTPVRVAPKVEHAKAQFNFLGGIPVPGTEESTAGMDCGLAGMIGGECVPIKVEADPYRTKRNITKGLLTIILMEVSKRIAMWVANRVDSRLRINDYLGYYRLVSQGLYAQRYIFDALTDPEDRLFTNILMAAQSIGGTSLSKVAGTLIADAQTYMQNLNIPAISLPNDPIQYIRMSYAGAPMSTPQGWYHTYNEQGLQARGSGAQAASLEILNAEGYKSARTNGDLQNMLQAKTLSYYTNSNNNKIPIMTPGGYAAKAIMFAMQKVLGTQSPYNQTNITAAIVADLVGGLINGGVFKALTGVGGTAATNDSQQIDSAAPIPGDNGGAPGAIVPCTIDTNGDGIMDATPVPGQACV